MTGGTITEASGAAVIFPPGAISTDTTFRIARDSSGAPPVPAELGATGSMYVITPHGGDFMQPVEVSIPAPSVTLQPNQQLKLAKAEPNGEWEILNDSTVVDGKLKAKVSRFSFFTGVTINYLLPIAQALPLEFTVTMNCGEQDCSKLVGPAAVSYTLVGNGGQWPTYCAGGRMEFFEQYQNGGRTVSPVNHRSSIPTSRFSFDVIVPPGPYTRYDFIPYMRCPETGSGSGWYRSIYWNEWAAFPNLSIAHMPAQLDVVDGRPATLESFLGGGAARVTWTGVGSVASAATATDRAIVDWQRSDDGGQSWRSFARSFQNEADPLPFGTGLSWRPWAVRHGFVANVTDQGALIRVEGCYTPPAPTAAPPCVTSPVTRINVLQQSALPAIVDQPRPVLIRTGETANFSVTVSGLPAPALRWQTRPANSTGEWTDVDVGAGATTASYITAARALSDNGQQYRVVATNALASAVSAPVTVSVSDLDVAPSITTQPASMSVTTGNDAMFAVVAYGTEALSYQWRFNGTNIAGANNPVLRLPAVTGSNAGTYSVAVSNSAGNATSNSAILTVSASTPTAVAPSIVTQPASVTANVGSTATLAVGVDGSGPLSFQWRRDGANIAGATSAVLTFPAVALPNAGSFSVVVSNSAGSVTSSNAVLDVSAASTPTAPSITSQPSTLIVPYRGSGVVAVGATGSGPLSYQWSKDGAELPGATLPVLDFRIVADVDVGTYTVTISNSMGSVVSLAVDIILLGAPVITQQPSDVTAIEGANATFFVTASSSGLRYQWSVNGSPIPGAIGATWNTGPVISANSGAVYSVSVYNGAGLVYSQGAVLTVQTIVAPTITQHPQNVTIEPGLQAEMCVTIGGTPTFDVQLQRWNGSSWAPGTDVLVNSNTEVCYFTDTLTLADNGAQYRFLVDNPAGEVTSNTATVTVQAPVVAAVTDTTLVSQALAGGPPNSQSNQPSISADGRYVAFTSLGTNLTADSVSGGKAYVRDMLEGTTRIINYSYTGNVSSGSVYNLKLSSNGRYAIFSSLATDLVPGDTNGHMDIFRRDLLLGITQRLSVMPNGDQLPNGVGGNEDFQLDISADGRIVMFLSANDITGTEPNGGRTYLFYRDLQTGFSRRVSASTEYNILYSALSEDGQYIAYASGVSTGTQSIQLYDVEAHSSTSVFSFDVSVAPARLREGMSISSDGGHIVFAITSPELLGSTRTQVIVVNSNTRAYGVASSHLGVVGDGSSAFPEISGDGRYVMFSTAARNIINDPALPNQIYLVVHDLVGNNNSIASVRSDGSAVWTGTGLNDQHALSEDGTTLAFVVDYPVISTGNFGYQVFAAPHP